MTATLSHRTEKLPSGTVVHVWTPVSSPVGIVQLQHGFAEYAERYVTEHGGLVLALVDRGYEVRAMDLRGHGRSPGRRAVTDGRAAVAEHVAVRRSLSGRELPVVLVGHSFGGLVTAASAARNAVGVRRVVLTAPVILGPTPSPVRIGARLLATLAPAAQLPGKAATMTRDPAVAERAAVDPLMHHGVTTFAVGSSALDVAHELWQRLDRWSVPTTIFHGTDDDAAAHSRSEAFVGAIGRTDVVLRTVEDGRHELLHDLPGDRATFRAVLDEIEAVG